METVLLAIQPEEGVAAVLHDPDSQATRSGEAPGLVEKLAAAKAKVEGLYTRWEELEAEGG